jgi:hypothetical protein
MPYAINIAGSDVRATGYPDTSGESDWIILNTGRQPFLVIRRALGFSAKSAHPWNKRSQSSTAETMTRGRIQIRREGDP